MCNMRRTSMKIGRVVPDTCSRTDRETDTLVAIPCFPTVGGVTNGAESFVGLALFADAMARAINSCHSARMQHRVPRVHRNGNTTIDVGS